MGAFRTGFTGSGTSGTGDRSATGTPTVGDLLVVGCVVANNSNTTPTCSDDQGGTYDLISAKLYASSLGVLSVFVRKQLVTSAVSHTITVATGANDAGIIGVAQISGMSNVGSAAVKQNAGQANQAAGGIPSASFSSNAKTGNVILGWVGNQSNPATMSPPTGFTERADLGQSSPAVGQEFATKDSGFTGTTITWNSTSSTAFASIILELDGSFTGTPPTLSVVTSRFAPLISTPRLATPPTLSVATTRFAPTVSTPRLVTVPKVAAALTTFAPAALVPRLVTPPKVAVTTASFAPTVLTPRLMTPPTVALVATRFAPTVSAPRVVTPPPASLHVAGYAPRILLPLLATPGPANLVISTFAPVITIERAPIRPPRAISLSACCPPDATLPPSILPGPARSSSFADAPTVDPPSPAPPAPPPRVARSSRALVRAGIRAALLNRTAAADRVHLNPSEAWSREMFPAIGLSYVSDRGDIVSDAQRQYLRTLELGVEVIVERRLGFEVGSNTVGDAIAFSESDELDDLCDQVERTLLADITLGGVAVDVRLVRTDMDFDERGERVLGAARITFNVSFFDPIVERPVLLARDLQRIHVDWKAPAPQSDPTAADDIAVPMS